MSRTGRDHVQAETARQDAALAALVEGVPYIVFLGIRFDRRGDELTAVLPFAPRLIGNPLLPALHGGAIAAFLEVAAIVELAWTTGPAADRLAASSAGPGSSSVHGRVHGAETGDKSSFRRPTLPRTIDFSVDYLRSGLPRDAYARARVNRSGRRYASVHVEAWQAHRDRLFAQATGHFLMPPRGG